MNEIELLTYKANIRLALWEATIPTQVQQAAQNKGWKFTAAKKS